MVKRMVQAIAMSLTMTLALLFSLNALAIELEVAVISDDKKQLAIAYDDKKIRLYSLDTGKLLNTLAFHEESIATVSFNKEGNQLLSGDWGDNAVLWDLNDGSIIKKRRLNGTVMHGHFSADGESIFLSVDDVGLLVFDKTLQRKRKQFSISDNLQLSKNKTLLAGQSGAGVTVVDTNNSKVLLEASEDAYDDQIYMTDDNAKLIIRDWSNFHVWDIVKKVKLDTINAMIDVDNAVLRNLVNEIWIAGDDSIEIHDYTTFQAKGILKFKEFDIDEIRHIAFSLDGKQAAVTAELADNSYKIIMIDTTSYKIQSHITPSSSAYYGTEYVDNDTLFIRSSYPTEVWNLATDSIKFRFNKNGSNLDLNLQDIARLEHEPYTAPGQINGMDVNPVTGNILTIGTSASNQELNAKGELQQIFLNPYSTGYDVRYSPNGKLAAFAYHGEHVLVYNVASNTLNKEYDLGGVPDGTRIIKFSKDSKLLAAGSDGNQLTIIDVEKKEVLKEVAFNAGVFSLQWLNPNEILVGTLNDLSLFNIETEQKKVMLDSPTIALDAHFKDGQLELLAVGREEDTTLLLDKNYKLIHTLSIEGVGRITFDKAAEYMIAATDYGVHLHNVASGKTKNCKEINDQLWAMAYDTEAKLIYAAGDNGKVSVWNHECQLKNG